MLSDEKIANGEIYSLYWGGGDQTKLIMAALGKSTYSTLKNKKKWIIIIYYNRTVPKKPM